MERQGGSLPLWKDWSPVEHQALEEAWGSLWLPKATPSPGPGHQALFKVGARVGVECSYPPSPRGNLPPCSFLIDNKAGRGIKWALPEVTTG